MKDFEIVGYAKSGRPIVGKDERGYRIYLNQCYECGKKFPDTNAGQRYCSDNCRDLHNAKKNIEIKNEKNKIAIEEKVQVTDKIKNTIKENLVFEIKDKITKKIEVKNIIIEFIKLHNRFPYMTDYICYTDDVEYESFRDIIKKFYKTKKIMMEELRDDYNTGAFKITSYCETCSSEIDTTYNSKKFCSKECKDNHDKYYLKCVICDDYFYSGNKTDRCCSYDCERVDSIRTYQIRLCELDCKIVKQCNTCGIDFMTGSYSIINCESCRQIKAEMSEQVNRSSNGSYFKTQKYVHNIISDLLPSCKIEGDKFYSFLSGLQLDIYIPELYLAFEYDGEQHYKYIDYFHKSITDFEDQQKRDKIKNTLCKKNNITLIRIKYDEFIDWRLIVSKIHLSGRYDVLRKIVDDVVNSDIVAWIENSYNI